MLPELSSTAYRTIGFKDAKDFIACGQYLALKQMHQWYQAKLTCDHLDLSDAVRISQDNADLGRGRAFLREFANLINDLFGGSLKPSWWGTRVWYGTGRYAFTIAVHATHGCDVLGS